MGVERFAALMSAGPEAFPLDEACLLIAAEADPSLDIDGCLRRLDEIADACASPLLESLVEHLYVDLGFAGNLNDYYDPRNSLLNFVLDRRIGIPITLAVVTLEVGRRIGVPMSGIGMLATSCCATRSTRTSSSTRSAAGCSTRQRVCGSINVSPGGACGTTPSCSP